MLGPGICVKQFLSFTQKICRPRKLRNTEAHSHSKSCLRCFVLQYCVFKTKHLKPIVQSLKRDFEWLEIFCLCVYFSVFEWYNLQLSQKSHLAVGNLTKLVLVNFITEKIEKCKHLVCLSFLLWLVSLREREKIFLHIPSLYDLLTHTSRWANIQGSVQWCF